MYLPFAIPGQQPVFRAEAVTPTLPSIEEFLDDLPSIEDFIDSGGEPLPSIDDYVMEAREGLDQQAATDAENYQAEYDADGWAIDGWQSYDWRGVGLLGVRGEGQSDEADAWNTLDWSSAPLSASANPARTRHSDPGPSADEVASALDGIARRIRSGELLIDQLSSTPPEAAMAAALASLLRLRD